MSVESMHVCSKASNFRIRSALLFLFLWCGVAHAQDPLGWNSPRAVGLIARARDRRELPRGDSTLQNYQAKGNGYVYFYLDRREGNDRTLVKVDQIALDLYWKRPNLTKQHIVGMRDVSRLPNRMYYHLDHFTVVQNGFGDVIKIGDGDEVSDVPHPAAPGADSIYDYRLADSVTLQLGGGQPEVRVYEVQVRPKRVNRPALVGSVFVDRGSADIVRMTFTFTPSSYVDRRLDYINISLDNGLFGGRYWLPNEQSVEIRRQIPELDFAAGAVIRGRLQIGKYAFNEPIPDSVFFGRPVTAVSEAQRKAYAFPDEIYSGLNTEGLAPPPQMQELRAQAAALLKEHRLSGLPPWRLYIPNASSVLRHDESEGWFAGLGATYAPSTAWRLDFTGGYAFAPKKPEGAIALRTSLDHANATVRAYYNEPRDIGPISGMPGVLNSLTSSWFGDTDYTDLYFTRGASVDVRSRGPRWSGFFLQAEQQRPSLSATSVSLTAPGNDAAIGIQVGKVLTDSGGLRWGGNVVMGLHGFKPEDNARQFFGRVLVNGEVRTSSVDLRSTMRVRFDAGANTGHRAPFQYRFLLGGRETIPGYDYRSLLANQFALTGVELARTIASPWLRARLLGYAAYTRLGEAPLLDAPQPPEGLRAAAGVGVGMLWDVVHVDFVRGDKWQTVISIRPDFWDML